MKALELKSWNTGRKYTKSGQRVAATILPSGAVLFVDIDRGIEGVLQSLYAGYEEAFSLREFVTINYDNGCYNGPTPEAYEYINGLRGAAKSMNQINH